MKRLYAIALIFAFAFLPNATRADDKATIPKLSARAVDLWDALRFECVAAHLSVVMDSSIPHRTISYALSGVAPHTLVMQLIQRNGLVGIQKDGIFYIAARSAAGGTSAITTAIIAAGTVPPASLAAAIAPSVTPWTRVTPGSEGQGVVVVQGDDDQVAIARAVAQQLVTTVHTAVIPVTTSAAELATHLLPALLPHAPQSVSALTNRNALVITGDDAFIKTARDTIAVLDAPPSTATYAVALVEITPRDEQLNQGISIGGVDLAPNFGGFGATQGTALQINASLAALESHGTARILQRGTIITVNGTTNSATYGTDVPILVVNSLTGVPTIRTISEGLTVSVLPNIGAQGITTDLHVEYSEAAGTGPQGYPLVNRRTTDSHIFTQSGQTIVVSGFYLDDKSETRGGAPPISHVPLLGSLFKTHSYQDEHNEVVMLLTPTNGDHSQWMYPSIPQDVLNNGIAPAPTPRP